MRLAASFREKEKMGNVLGLWREKGAIPAMQAGRCDGAEGRSEGENQLL